MKKLYIIGIGPGDPAHMTEAARHAITEAEVLCGYTTYMDLIRPLYPDKEFFTTPMTRETERCERAVKMAESGRCVAMLCSGDAGVYGMASPCLTLAEGRDVEVEIVPGVTAALSGAAVLGAPLSNDFCVISLSDLLTPWETIEKRLNGAGAGDFCICIYNPMSKGRREHLKQAADILLKYKEENTVCGYVQKIGREGQRSKILTLKELRDEEVDMLTTVFIGNRDTRILGGKMVTRRGYEEKK